MKYKVYLTLPFAVLLLVLGINPSWAAPPPNPTASDENWNTAGGSGVLLKNLGSGNTGFGNFALSNNTTGFYNTAIGFSSLTSNTTGSTNTVVGFNSMQANTTGSFNIAVGFSSLSQNTKGYSNIGIGSSALEFNSIGRENIAIGNTALPINSVGSQNTAVGTWTLQQAIDGSNNTALGHSALRGHMTGNGNTALGVQALQHVFQGNQNLALGANAGYNLTGGDYNIYLSSAGSTTESSTIRIGNKVQHTRTFISGIRGITTGAANAVAVVIDGNGQLGTISSSERFKKDIQDMNESSHRLLQLRPVTYHYKQASEDGSNPLEYGLIAEEVAKVYPDLVVYGADGKVETVQYQKLTPMLVNEVKRLNSVLQAEKNKNVAQMESIKNQDQKITAQEQEITHLKQQMTSLQAQSERIEALTSRLSRIEANQTLGMVEK